MFCQTWSVKLAPVIQPCAGTISPRTADDGFSFTEDYRRRSRPSKHTVTLCHLARLSGSSCDVSLQDNQQDAPLFAFLQKTELMEAIWIIRLLNSLFEIQPWLIWNYSTSYRVWLRHRVGQALTFLFKYYGARLCSISRGWETLLSLT